MSFISLEFLLIFLPLSLCFFSLAVRVGVDWMPSVAIVCISLGFYSGFGVIPVSVLIFSVVANYAASQIISRYLKSKWPIGVALIGNLSLLFCFKYISAFDLSESFRFMALISLVGISYFTFQQIAYLLQLRAGQVPLLAAHDYAQFVLFFPILTSGPIIRASDFQKALSRPRKISIVNLQVGLVLICIGIFKKTMIAEPLSPVIDHVFSADSVGLSTLEAWIGALAFTFQIYFDFSGYSDIAIGCARLFGIIIPINFLSPLRSANIQDFWRRWHMSMTKFFADFVYTPMAVAFTRLSVKNSLPKQSVFILTVALPTTVTFILVGLWHDAGINFALFGLLHGLALSCYHWWLGLKLKSLHYYPAWSATFIFLVFTLVLFRAPEFSTTVQIWKAMSGIEAGAQVRLDHTIFDLWFFSVLLVSAVIVFFCPSSHEFLEKYEPGISFDVPVLPSVLVSKLIWKPSTNWALFLGILAGTSFIFSLWTGISTFVYVRF